MFGTCTGTSSERTPLSVTASAFTLPALICGMAGGPSEIANNVWPCIRLRIISLLLL